MICHKSKCIFIHIPRTAGSSIEIAIQGKNQWAVDMRRKHLIASTAKRLYKDYWDEYFKFSFIRNPWDRVVSMCKYGNKHPREWNRIYGCEITNGLLNMDNYEKIYPDGIEIDPRFEFKNEIPQNIIPNSVYLNILNEKLDFVGRFENLKHDIEYISDKLSRQITLPLVEKSIRKHYSVYYNEEVKNKVANTYLNDISRFGYEFNEPADKWKSSTCLIK
jgi:hypothetical protein